VGSESAGDGRCGVRGKPPGGRAAGARRPGSHLRQPRSAGSPRGAPAALGALRRRVRPGRHAQRRPGARQPRRHRRGLPPGRGRGRGPVDVPDRRLHRRQHHGHGAPAAGPGGRPHRRQEAPGGQADRGLVHVHLRRGALRPARRRRAAEHLAPGRPAACPAVGAARRGRHGAAAPAHRRGQAAGPHQHLRAHQGRPGKDGPADRRGVRHSLGGAPLLQHLRPAPGAVESLHGGGRHLQRAPAERAAAADLRRRRAEARLRVRARHRAGAAAVGGRRGRGRQGVQRGLGARRERARGGGNAGPRAGKRRRGAGDGQVPRGRHPALLRRHLPCPRGAGVRAPRDVRAGDGRAGGLAAGAGPPAGRGGSPRGRAGRPRTYAV
ncbi:MAG: UDP-glucose 4-epimerase, partial [uncultured Gemmatimonadetes bacterium]